MTVEAPRTVEWQSPSNIALVKYWGKKFEQIPTNPSISLTLSRAYSTTSVSFKPVRGEAPVIDFTFEGSANEKFANRVRKFVTRVFELLPALEKLDLQIDSSNSFPHSAGIASSASAMSALGLALCSIQEPDFDGNEAHFRRLASTIARLGSGSASRSVAGPVMLWGQTDLVEGSSDEYALPFAVNPVFNTYRDSILIIDSAEKEVKSTAGHALMNDHPYAERRFERARQNLGRILPALTNGDLQTFVEVVEAEALDLHAMMMTSTPPYLLMRPATVKAIEELRAYREATGIPVCFTLDAGPNVHVLYPDAESAKVSEWLDKKLKPLCQDGRILHDHVSGGPVRIQ